MKTLCKPLIVLLGTAAIILLANSCQQATANKEGYIIQGNIAGLGEGKAVLARLDLVSNERVEVDTADIKNGDFFFEGRVDAPYLHTIFLNGYQEKIHVFLENSEIQIEGDVNDLANAMVTGSREDSLFRAYGLDDIFDRKLGMEIMLQYPDYCFSAFTAYYQFQIHNIATDTLDRVMDGFTESVRNSEYYKHLESLYQTLRKVAISQAAPPFTIPDTEGNPVELKDFLGTYVLIDFWASWCAPCRATNPLLVEVYEQFSHKNFTIIGISVDKDEGRWKSAIEADKLPWINLSNLQGWDAVADTYGVKAIPQNFLLDPQGIIIDKNVEPEQLIDKLDSLLSNSSQRN